jgi:hypothetical protein
MRGLTPLPARLRVEQPARLRQRPRPGVAGLRPGLGRVRVVTRRPGTAGLRRLAGGPRRRPCGHHRRAGHAGPSPRLVSGGRKLQGPPAQAAGTSRSPAASRQGEPPPRGSRGPADDPPRACDPWPACGSSFIAPAAQGRSREGHAGRRPAQGDIGLQRLDRLSFGHGTSGLGEPSRFRFPQ